MLVDRKCSRSMTWTSDRAARLVVEAWARVRGPGGCRDGEPGEPGEPQDDNQQLHHRLLL